MNNEKYPRVSVITVCYNSVETIEQTILSVINQTYPNVEYVIIDGGSTDGTLDIIKKYASKITFWTSEKDNGIADAWNKGILKSTGEVIGIINSDDYYLPDTVEIVVDSMLRKPEYSFVFGDIEIIDKNGINMYALKGNPNYSTNINYDTPLTPHPTVFIKKEVYEKYGLFDLTYKTALDYEFLLRIYKAGVMGLYVNETLATMMLGGESDINFKRACREIKRASIAYGYPPLKANLRLHIKLFKTTMRRMIDRVGFSSITRLYRKLFCKHFNYHK